MKPKFWDAERPLLVSFSGGKSSALMLRLIQLHYGLDDCVVLFANTGKENPETLDFVNAVGRNWGIHITWIEAVINPTMGVGVTFKEVTYETAAREGQPFEAMIRKYGLPSRLNRFCTGELKVKPMQKYMRHLGFGEWITAIGIRADEPTRLKQHFYPLAEVGITTQKVQEFWGAQPFSLNLPDFAGNCDMCHLKSLSKRIKCAERKPAIVNWWQKMEEFTGETFDRDISVKRINAIATGRKQQLQLDFSHAEVDLNCVCDSL